MATPVGTLAFSVYLSNGDGSHWELTLTYNGTTGAPLLLIATNTHPTATATLLLTVTVTGTVQRRSFGIPPGKTAPNVTSLTSTLKGLGVTDIVTQLVGIGGASI